MGGLRGPEGLICSQADRIKRHDLFFGSNQISHQLFNMDGVGGELGQRLRRAIVGTTRKGRKETDFQRRLQAEGMTTPKKNPSGLLPENERRGEHHYTRCKATPDTLWSWDDVHYSFLVQGGTNVTWGGGRGGRLEARGLRGATRRKKIFSRNKLYSKKSPLFRGTSKKATSEAPKGKGTDALRTRATAETVQRMVC